LCSEILAQNTQVENTENQGSLPKSSKKDCEGNQRKMRLLGQKLSLKSGRSEADVKTVKQDPVASHLPSMAGSAYPTACFSDVSGGQNDTSEKMSIGTASGVVSKIEYQGNNKNLQLPTQELSITSEAPSKTSVGNDVFVLPNHFPTTASHANDHAMQSSHDILENSFPRRIGGSSGSSCQPPEGNRRNIRTLGLKLSLKSVKPEKKSDDQKENMAPNLLPPQLGFNKSQKRPLDAVSRKQFSGGPAVVQQNPITEHQQSNIQVVSTEECNQGRKKLFSLSRRLSLKSQQSGLGSACDKEYKPPNCSLRDNKLSELPLPAPPAPIPKGEAMAPNEPQPQLSAPTFVKSEVKALGFAGPQKDADSGNSSVKQNAVSVENAVVSDSEDSEDEGERPPRSRLSLMRRRLAVKQRT
jgi:ubiquitin-conjugating enzyme E2 T